VRDGDRETQTIAELPLNLLLPGAAPRPIAAARIGQDEDMAGLRIALVPLGLPPCAETGDCEGGGLV
jgi:hypothetical protein